MESSKVKLPKEVANSIEFIRKGFAESSVHDVKWLEGPIDDNEDVRKAKDTILNFIVKRGWPDQFSPNHPLIIYHKALVNGYEIEQTPEDKVRELYDEYKMNEQKARVRNDTDAEERLQLAAFAIRETLDALNIKIKGVNDHE